MDTSQVTNMSQMFLNCRSLKELDLSSFKTNQVSDMSQMFGGCSDLRMLNITNFNTSQVTNMNGMFAGCETLEKLDLSNFDTTNVKSMSNMFESSDALKSLKLGENFIVPKDKEADLKLVDKVWIDIGTGTEDNPKPKNKKGINSVELLALSDKGNWVEKPAKEYHGPMTVKIYNNLDNNLKVEVPANVQPEYVGSTFELTVPQKAGYQADKKTVMVIAMKDGLLGEDAVTYEKVKSAPVAKPVQSVQPLSSVRPLSSVEPVATESLNSIEPNKLESLESVEPKPLASVTPAKVSSVATATPKKVAPVAKPVKPRAKGEITKFMNYVTVFPDLKIAKVYDSTGMPVLNHGLVNNHSWYSDKLMTLGNEKYYHVVDDKWVKASDVYLYDEVKKTVRTKDVQITRLVNSHAKAITNRGLCGLFTINTDKIAILNQHKYYQVSANEFVDVDSVDVVNA